MKGFRCERTVLTAAVLTCILLALVKTESVNSEVGLRETNHRASRHKRSSIYLFLVLRCFVPDVNLMTGLIDYGCYCGIGGKGTPVDDVDRCCQLHDQCYGIMQEKTSCKGVSYFFVTYSIGKCINNSLHCKSENDDGYTSGKATNRCRREMCECDIAMGRCLQAAKYDEKYEKYPAGQCKIKDG